MPGTAIIFHGTGANPEVCWYQWLGRRLTDRGYAVEIPHYPGLCRILFERLGGTQIVRDDGHFGDHDQPYESFELLDRLIA